MPDNPGHSADHANRRTLACWPRLMDLHLASAYFSVAERTIEDWIADGLLTPVPMPGSTLRKKKQIIAHAKDRRIAKILLAKEDIDALIDRMKGTA